MTSLISRRNRYGAWVYLALFLQTCNGFYLHDSYMHTYSTRDEIFAKVNSLTSIIDPPFSYYGLPYCIPHEGIKRSAQNLGELLMGDQIHNSPYRFRMNINESIFLCTTHPLNENEVKLLTQRTQDMYQVNIVLDNLPVERHTYLNNGFKLQWIGFPVGFHRPYSDDYYIVNHLKFTVLIHEYEEAKMKINSTEASRDFASEYQIVGFEVEFCSIKYDPTNMTNRHMYDIVSSEGCPREFNKFQIIKKNEQVSYTYEVRFVMSDIKWSSRWDAYLKMEGSPAHWFSIMNSLAVICILAGFVLVIFFRMRRDLMGYEELDKGAGKEISGWKLVVRDVFREPVHSKLLCVMIGDGVQITGMGIATIIFAVLGYMSPASRGTLLTGMILLYVSFGMAAGYVGVRMWTTLKGSSEGWRSVSLSLASFFPGMVFVILTVLNFFLWSSKSSRAIPISLYLMLLSLWFFISVPLTLLGGFFSSRTEPIQYPVSTNQIPREIPSRKIYSWFLVLVAGTLPFGTIFVEFFFILNGMWFGRFYYAYGFLLIVLPLLVIVCIEVSIIVTYMHLRAEDWMWWWKAFFASGSVSLYVFMHSIYFFVFNLQGLSSNLVTITLYLGYSMIIAITIMLSTGTIGLLASFYFIHYLFSSVKID